MANKNVNAAKFLGGLEELLQFISSHSAEITAKGLTPATLTTNITAGKNEVSLKNGTQENAKTALKNATNALQLVANVRYPEFSSVIDLLRGAFGVSTPEAKQLTRLRQQVIGRGNAGGGSGSSSDGGGGDSSGGGGGGGSS
jgi:hypothetical protein